MKSDREILREVMGLDKVDLSQVWLFKVRDYNTILLGRYEVDEYGCGYYYVQRGDGVKYIYADYRVEWKKRVLVTDYLPDH